MIYLSPNNEYPRHIGDIKLEHPDFKEGNKLPDGWAKVEMVAPPKAKDGEIVFEDFPIQTDSGFAQNWKVRNLTEQEILKRDAEATLLEKLAQLTLNDYEKKVLSRGVQLKETEEI